MSGVRTSPSRILVLWCPDWPVIAAEIIDGVDAHGPVAVMHANRVLACSPAARGEGIRRSLRKREAQGRCPNLVVVNHDPGRDARAFEPVIAAVEELAPGVEVMRPGACALAARGPSSYYGGEIKAAERLVEHIALTCAVEAQAGVADGVFAALLAARAGRIVPRGGTPGFLAGMSIATLDRPDLADLLRRLGVRTLGEFAALPAGDVLSRFGFDAAFAHNLAAGRGERPLAARKPPPDLAVTGGYDPPLERVDTAAFAARALAERVHERLAGYGLAATRLGIEARTAAGEHDGVLSAADIADRVRWQLDGWLTGAGRGGIRRPGSASQPDRPSAGIDVLRLIPDGVVRQAGMQAGLWGETGVADERAHRALVRVQGLLGPDSVYTTVLGGGRSYTDRVRLVPWGEERSPAQPSQSPWPGQLPAPAPASVWPHAPGEAPDPATLITVSTAGGALLTIDDRLEMTGPPAKVRRGREPPRAVTGWAGPWPVDERWWAPEEANRRLRLQLHLDDGTALLAAFDGRQWVVEGVYD
jgi:protein ImuB